MRQVFRFKSVFYWGTLSIQRKKHRIAIKVCSCLQSLNKNPLPLNTYKIIKERIYKRIYIAFKNLVPNIDTIIGWLHLSRSSVKTSILDPRGGWGVKSLSYWSVNRDTFLSQSFVYEPLAIRPCFTGVLLVCTDVTHVCWAFFYYFLVEILMDCFHPGEAEGW